MMAALAVLAGTADLPGGAPEAPRMQPRRPRTGPHGMRQATERPWCSREKARRARQLARGVIRRA